MRLRRKLTALVGPEDADLLIANLSDDASLLPSLGPVAGLARVAAGEMEREAYLEAYGHRGPHEFEISEPRPVEDPTWLDRQLAAYRESPIDVDGLLEKQRTLSNGARERLLAKAPRQARSLLRRLDESARRGSLRERARSEYVRDRWMVRLFALRAGELTGLNEEVFFLTLDELLALLSGDEAAVRHIPSRRDTYQRYLTLPPFPSIIRGRFDPFQWAADPHRRSDIYDASAPPPSAADMDGEATLRGSPGSAGRVEGIVRVMLEPDGGDPFQDGEILVTTQTDISWTTLFPRAAAVITDVGAPLSHAAIVARELGVPAVVGCGDATARLRTGDRVWVDGGRGVVEIIESV
jgi:pyruvate,water dikinase